MEIALERIYIFCFLAVTLDPEKNAEKGSMPLTILGLELTCLSLFKDCYIFCNDSSSSDFWVIWVIY